MLFPHMTNKKCMLLRFLSAIALALTIAVFLPAISFADIENLYADGYSSSVTITNPSNAYGAPDGNTAYGSYADANVRILGGFRDQYLLSDAVGSLFVDFYYQYSPTLAKVVQGNRHLRSITRMGLLPLVGASRVFTRVNLAERWPLLITIAVILSVLLYMELLIRRYRRPRTKPVHPENVSHFSSKVRPGTRKSSGNSENG